MEERIERTGRMLITVTGGSGSGKSAFAEDTVLRLSGYLRRGTDRAAQIGLSERERTVLPPDREPVYLAAMAPFGREALRRVARHRALRSGKGFETIEKTDALWEIPPEDLEGRTVLLEDLSNLISNEMFGVPGRDGYHGKEAAYGCVMKDIGYLLDHAGDLVVVMNEIYADGQQYDTETENFLCLTGEVSCELACMADRSYEVVYGIPVLLKKKTGNGDRKV